MGTATERTVNNNLLTVEHWREQLTKLLPKEKSLKDLADQLAQRDHYYEGVTGYSRLQNITNGRGGLQATSRTVQ
ncbi:MAG: hypothetical protein EOO88_45775, partial [Pedobacter sp.]